MNPRQMMIQSVAKKMMGRQNNKRRGQMRAAPAQLGQPMKAPNSVMGFDPLMPQRQKRRNLGGGY